MGNRELPQWLMPDLFGSAAYTRNTFFHALAGGVRGLAYFRYPVRATGAWSALKQLATVVERIGPVWGIGADGELNNMYKRTPQQGLWFIAGGLPQCRINSKFLALQIKAMELGLLGPL